MHSDRMKKLGRYAIPDKSTKGREIIQKKMDLFSRDPEIQKKIKKTVEKAVVNCELQQLNGAGLPADIVLREYNQEYNNRSFHYSLRKLPSSFNVVEAFNTLLPESATFQINQEVDCVFSFNEYLDFITSDECPDDIKGLKGYMEEGIIYSFNSTDEPSNIIFSTKNGKEFGVRSISLIKHGDEVSILMLSGQKCDLELESENLRNLSISIQNLNDIKPDDSVKVEAIPLSPESELWRTIVLARIDISTSTVDARYVFQDSGQSFIGYSDDINSYINQHGDFASKELKESFIAQNELMKDYTPLFELCKTALYLPVFRNEFEDTISIERHPTMFGEKRNKPSLRKTNKLAKSKLKISFRNVECINTGNRNPPARREFLAPEMKIETRGYWKKLDFQSVGEDKNRQPIHGRTWVTKTIEWAESEKNNIPLKVSTKNFHRENEGYIYVMRSAAHEKNVFKVGLTRRDSETRSKELSRSTSSPDHFLVVEDWEVSDCVLAEKLIHERLDEYRVNPKREYFKAPYKVIFKVIDEVIDNVSNN
jgi:hypothetical protein